MIFKVFILMLFTIAISLAHYHRAYFHSENDGFVRYPNWMEYISDDWMLSELALPGTHDSSTFTSSNPSVGVQAINFYQQLIYGIRVFDIRFRHTSNGFALHHWKYFLNVMFGDFLNNVTTFLQQYPSETVLFRLKEERPEDNNNSRSKLETLKFYLRDHKDHYLHTGRDIKLGVARGKFIILVNDGAFKGYGLDYPSFEIQDNYKLNTNWDLHWKWNQVRDHLLKSCYGDKTKFYVNYLSGSKGSFPYFVASGHILPGTNADRLWTGLVALKSDTKMYPDFPRLNCFLGICSIYFEGTNILTNYFLFLINQFREFGRSEPQRTVGIIMADFPGTSLIYEIIMNNWIIAGRKNIQIHLLFDNRD